MSKPEPTHCFSPYWNSPFLLPSIRSPSPALPLRLLCLTGDVLGAAPGLETHGRCWLKTLTCFFFPWGKGPNPVRDGGEGAGGWSSRWAEPSPAVSSAPRCVRSSGVTAGTCSPPSSLARASRGQAGLAALAAAQVCRGLCLSSGAAWLCLPGAISAALGWGARPRGRHKAAAEVGGLPQPRFVPRGARSDCETHEKGTLTPGRALCLALCFLEFHREGMTGWSTPVPWASPPGKGEPHPQQ